jgi:very-short-patch-repair endonuclease
VIEIDGRLYHTGAEVFETDRRRQNLLVLDGWCVLRFTLDHDRGAPRGGHRDGA